MYFCCHSRGESRRQQFRMRFRFYKSRAGDCVSGCGIQHPNQSRLTHLHFRLLPVSQSHAARLFDGLTSKRWLRQWYRQRNAVSLFNQRRHRATLPSSHVDMLRYWCRLQSSLTTLSKFTVIAVHRAPRLQTKLLAPSAEKERRRGRRIDDAKRRFHAAEAVVSCYRSRGWGC